MRNVKQIKVTTHDSQIHVNNSNVTRSEVWLNSSPYDRNSEILS